MTNRELDIWVEWCEWRYSDPPNRVLPNTNEFSTDGRLEFSKYLLLQPAGLTPVFLHNCVKDHNYIYTLRAWNKLNVNSIGAAITGTAATFSNLYAVTIKEETFYCAKGIILNNTMTPLLIVLEDRKSSDCIGEGFTWVTLYINSTVFARDTPLKKYIVDKLLGALPEYKQTFKQRNPLLDIKVVVDDPTVEDKFITPAKPTGLIDNDAVNTKVKEFFATITNL